jgi:ER lumen protein retaining receptor
VYSDAVFCDRYFSEGVVDPIAVIAGIVQTGLYLDFFYVYFTK